MTASQQCLRRPAQMSDPCSNPPDPIASAASEYGFSFHLKEGSEPSEAALVRSHVTVHLRIDGDAIGYLYIELRACEEGGRRTDLNDCESLLLATFLRLALPASCSLVDVPHPALDTPEEIYARLITIDQFYRAAGGADDSPTAVIRQLLTAIVRFQSLFPAYLDWTPCGDQKGQPDFSYDGARDWGTRVSTVLGKPFDSPGTYSNSRTNPTWKYLRNIDAGVSVFQAPGLSSFVRRAGTVAAAKWEVIDGINGKLYISKAVRNIVSFKNIRLIKRILSALSVRGEDESVAIVPLENFVVAARGEHTISLNRDCGRVRFESERERMRKRHAEESRVLFPITSFIWQDAIEGEEFESMTRDLLRHEKGLLWVRRIGSGNEADGGRDLIAMWMTPPLPRQAVGEGQNAFTTRKVIVQCKGIKGSVGKSKVRDIRDTIEHNGAQGYFLSVSSHLSTGLTDHLLKLREEGTFWIDWWTRTEIEEKLRGHPEVAARYPNIVRIGDS
jgi:hypothetical protein